jgi:hypothetical protein
MKPSALSAKNDDTCEAFNGRPSIFSTALAIAGSSKHVQLASVECSLRMGTFALTQSVYSLLPM